MSKAVVAEVKEHNVTSLIVDVKNPKSAIMPDSLEYYVKTGEKLLFDSGIKRIWRTTGELITKHGIKKWGVVTPDSTIRKMTLRRVISLGGKENRSYDILLSESESEILDWIHKS